jgi:hypothetical protein
MGRSWGAAVGEQGFGYVISADSPGSVEEEDILAPCLPVEMCELSELSELSAGVLRDRFLVDCFLSWAFTPCLPVETCELSELSELSVLLNRFLV